jgi:hypothetical protein
MAAVPLGGLAQAKGIPWHRLGVQADVSRSTAAALGSARLAGTAHALREAKSSEVSALDRSHAALVPQTAPKGDGNMVELNGPCLESRTSDPQPWSSPNAIFHRHPPTLTRINFS